ncbi:MAG: type II toxin-antitoxin system HicB family antitoxin [Permianibacter sp.]
MPPRWPIAVEPGDDVYCWGVIVPDLPGCFSAGETLAEALQNAPIAIATHLALLREDNEVLPCPRQIEDHFDHPDYTGMLWSLALVAE